MNKKIKIILFSIFCFVLLFSPIFLVNKGFNNKLNKSQNNDNVKILKDVENKYDLTFPGHIKHFVSGDQVAHTLDNIDGEISEVPTLTSLDYGMVMEDGEGQEHLYMLGDNTYGQIGNGDEKESFGIHINNIPGFNNKPNFSLFISLAEIKDDISEKPFLPPGSKIKQLKIGVEGEVDAVVEDSKEFDHLYTWGATIMNGSNIEDPNFKPVYKPTEITKIPGGNSFLPLPSKSKIKIYNNKYNDTKTIIIRDSTNTDHLYCEQEYNDKFEEITNSSLKEGTSGSPLPLGSKIIDISQNSSNSSFLLVNDGENEHLYFMDGFDQRTNIIEIKDDSKSKALLPPGSKITNFSNQFISLFPNLSTAVLLSVNDGGEDHLYQITEHGNFDNLVIKEIKDDSKGEPLLPPGSKITQISSTTSQPGGTTFSPPGYNFGLVIENRNIDTLYMWGLNGYGQIGNGDDGWDRHPSGAGFWGNQPWNEERLLPKPIMVKSLLPGQKITQLVLDRKSSFAVVEETKSSKTFDQLYGWGKNDIGQLGNDNSDNKKINWSPNLISLSTDNSKTKLVKSSVSKKLSAFVKNTDGTKHLYSWGSGILSGNSPKDMSLIPNPYDKGAQSLTQNFKIVDTPNLHVMQSTNSDFFDFTNISIVVIEDEETAKDHVYIMDLANSVSIPIFSTSFAWRSTSRPPPSGHNGGNDSVLDGHLGKVYSGGFFAKWKHIYIIIDSFLLITAIMLMIAFGSLLYKSKK